MSEEPKSGLITKDEMAASVAVAPRVSVAEMEANIATENYLNVGEAGALLGKPGHPRLKALTICIITTRNGYVLTGESAPVDEANFSEELGRKFARDDAVRKLWPLMGYELRERLHAATPAPEPPTWTTSPGPEF